MVNSCHMLRAALLLLVVLAGPLTTAQEKFRLLKIQTVGTKNYTTEQVLAAAGLRLNTDATQQQLQDAAARLADMGVFESVTYEFRGVPGGVIATFKVEDRKAWSPIVYQNFVWFTRSEIEQNIAQKIPLFTGIVPVTGNMPDLIRDALAQMLTERKLPSAVVQENEAFGPMTAVAYKVENVQVKVAELNVEGLERIPQKMVQDALANVKQDEWLQSHSNRYIRETLGGLFRQQGFLESVVGDARVKLVDPAAPAIAVTVPVQEGRKFQFAGATFTGNTAYPEAELQKLVSLKPGETADLKKFQETMFQLRTKYEDKGYMRMSSSVKPILGEADQAKFEVAIAEGKAFSMGRITFEGFSASSVEVLKSRWKLAQGEPYSGEYVRQFMKELYSMLPPNRIYSYELRADVKDVVGQVNLTIAMKASK